jgi:hypothetical protein
MGCARTDGGVARAPLAKSKDQNRRDVPHPRFTSSDSRERRLEPRSGSFVDSLPVIWRRYITSLTLFWLDALTSIPVSFLELSLSQACASALHVPCALSRLDSGAAQVELAAVLLSPLLCSCAVAGRLPVVLV